MGERSHRSVRLLTAALLVAVGLLIVVSWWYRSLTLDAQTLSERVTEPYRGMHVPVLERETLEGAEVAVGSPQAGELQLLLFFNTTCSYCQESVPPWKDLTEQLCDVLSVELVGIARDSVAAAREYVAEQDLEFPVVSVPDLRWTHLFRTRSVPYALAVDGDGRVV
jgi:peroxiredoxin